MDRESADRKPVDVTSVEILREHAPSGRMILSVCVACKAADGATPVGRDMFESLSAAIDRSVQVRQVQCLGVCKRPATVAVTSADGYTFLFGDLQTESGTAALLSFVESYRTSDYGLVPWRARADVLRKGMVARVPPARWSPDDGAAPK